MKTLITIIINVIFARKIANATRSISGDYLDAHSNFLRGNE